jgi:hypothetical protein
MTVTGSGTGTGRPYIQLGQPFGQFEFRNCSEMSEAVEIRRIPGT